MSIDSLTNDLLSVELYHLEMMIISFLAGVCYSRKKSDTLLNAFVILGTYLLLIARRLSVMAGKLHYLGTVKVVHRGFTRC